MLILINILYFLITHILGILAMHYTLSINDVTRSIPIEQANLDRIPGNLVKLIIVLIFGNNMVFHIG